MLKIIFYDSLLGKWLDTIFTSDGDIIGSEVPHFLLAIYIVTVILMVLQYLLVTVISIVLHYLLVR